jgi:hypothetical protein
MTVWILDGLKRMPRMRRRRLMDASRVSVENEWDGWLVDDNDDGGTGGDD